MKRFSDWREPFDYYRWFSTAGAYVLVDGQYGSTGKGVMAAALGEFFGDRVDLTLSNAGPNSGHTHYRGDTPVILKQTPTFSVASGRAGVQKPLCYLTGGAVVDLELLKKECLEHGVTAAVHPAAAVITDQAREADKTNVSNIASTGQGVGSALQAKLGRSQAAVYGLPSHAPGGLDTVEERWKAALNMTEALRDLSLFVEVSQGYSLGLNSGAYPYVTTRECTVSQALADAGLAPTAFRKSVMAVRTYPIRVGNTENSSGPCYPDQEEISWEDIGQAPEFTTVTKRQRRIFTWSRRQFCDALRANDPSVVFLNFAQYLSGQHDLDKFVERNIYQDYVDTLRREPETILLGFGPRTGDIVVWNRS